jgi:hypothetical protein
MGAEMPPFFLCLTNTKTKCFQDMKTSWYIVASGPSLTVEDVNAIKGQNVIVINDNYLLAPWASVLYACDGQWWDWHQSRNELKDFKGRKLTQDKEAANRYGLEYIESVDAPGLSKDINYIHMGSNSGIQAINLAYHFGANRIILLGYDMQATDNKSHWFGDHPNGFRSYWHRWLPIYKAVADDANKMNLEIINASRETALTCFARVSLNDILR